MFKSSKIFTRVVAICFASTIGQLTAELSIFTGKNNCEPITIEDYFSSGSHLQNRVKDLFGNFSPDLQTLQNFGLINRFPFLSISETESTVVVKAELPGLDENEVKVDTHKNHLIISGEKKNETNNDKSTCHVCELTYGKFSRDIALPFEIEVSKVEASFAKGVLTITIQKPAEAMTKTQSVPINKKGKK